MNLKKVITWEDADMNCCIIAASILSAAVLTLRVTGTLGRGVLTTDNGETIPRDYAEDGERSVYSWLTISPICWWSFQNLVRIRLKQARKEIKENLYGRGNSEKVSKQASRNATRRSGTKYGRKKTR